MCRLKVLAGHKRNINKCKLCIPGACTTITLGNTLGIHHRDKYLKVDTSVGTTDQTWRLTRESCWDSSSAELPDNLDVAWGFPVSCNAAESTSALKICESNYHIVKHCCQDSVSCLIRHSSRLRCMRVKRWSFTGSICKQNSPKTGPP